MENHIFLGKWITNAEFAKAEPRNVFHRQLQPLAIPDDRPKNRHILFRRHFLLPRRPQSARIFITADDYYKLYVNGMFVGQGPAPGYPQKTRYNVWDVEEYLEPGDNVIAVHTLYQGLVNRVWVSGDERHGLLLDFMLNGRTAFGSDEDFLTQIHTGYRAAGITSAHSTQFLEEYDSAAPEVGFEKPDFDDDEWKNASLREYADWQLVPQETKCLDFEEIWPVEAVEREIPGDPAHKSVYLDFGKTYVGYLLATAHGEKGDSVRVRCAQELSDESAKQLLFDMRCRCLYDENWLLSGEEEDELDWFDYKALRYAELILPKDANVWNICLRARHYPFALRAKMRPEFAGNDDLNRIWDLCAHTLQYGVQEVIQDCMDREKGFYVGDGCYTALAHMLLTGDDTIVRKLIDDGLQSAFITDGLVTCLDCAFMQEIAEYPLMLISLILWHYRLTGDREYLRNSYPGVRSLLDAYRRDYEKNGLLCDLDKWCVVDWPANFRDGYDVDITEGQICHEPHIAINAYYIEAVECANEIARVLGAGEYRDPSELKSAFKASFYDERRHIFTDSVRSDHVSFIGNVFPFAFGLVPDDECEANIRAMIDARGVHSVSFFGTFAILQGLARRRDWAAINNMLLDPGAWLRMLSEGATTTYESWGRDTKWNTSLFHLTFSFASIFLCLENEALFDRKTEG